MARDADNFISEVFWTTDQRFSFQKVGRYYNLYDRDSGYSFLRDFRSFNSSTFRITHMMKYSAIPVRRPPATVTRVPA